jgi:hypothetical protein
MPAEVSLLSEVPFFEDLDEAARATLASLVNVVSIKSGTHVFHAGDPGDTMYILRSGEVEVFFKDTTGNRIVLETCRAGAFSATSRCSTRGRGPRRCWPPTTSRRSGSRAPICTLFWNANRPPR